VGLGRVAIFLTVLTAVVALFSAYIGWRLIPASWSPGARTAAWVGIAVLVVAQPLSFVLRFTGKEPGALGDALSWVAYTAMGLFALTLTFTILRDLGWLGVRVAGGLPVDPARREMLFDVTSGAVLAVAAGALGVGFARAVAKPTVVDVTVPIKDLPQALAGFTIAQISDIHIGPTIKRGFLEEVVAAVNGLNADLVAVTGDLVDGSVDELRDQTAPLADLKARHGAWFITGNHEYYSGALAWLAEVRRLGLKTLVDEHQVIEHDGEKIVVAGVTDYSSAGMVPEHASDPHKAAAGAPVDALRILLAHQPRSAYEAEKAGFHLQLSGHTHGGQFFPGTLLVRLAQPFVEGLHQLGGMWVYTNRGTGYWGPPIRHTSVTSEVTRLTLVRA
jgi:predicted MPP superfamily phosphohydrolase